MVSWAAFTLRCLERQLSRRDSVKEIGDGGGWKEKKKEGGGENWRKGRRLGGNDVYGLL